MICCGVRPRQWVFDVPSQPASMVRSAVAFHDVGGEGDDRHAIEAGVLAEAGGEGVAIHIGHIDVHEDEVRAGFFDGFKGIGGGIGFDDIKVFSHQDTPDEHTVFGVIFYI
jgi:hypothetical protein